MSTLRVDTIQNAAGTDSPINVPGTAKAWVNFNGTGTVAIRASYNVSSITDNGTGSYTVNLTTAMPDVNGSAVVSAAGSSSTANPIRSGVQVTSTSGIAVRTDNNSAVASDFEHVYVQLFR